MRKESAPLFFFCAIFTIALSAAPPPVIGQNPLPPRKSTTSEGPGRDRPQEQADWFMSGRRYPATSRRLRTLRGADTAAAKLREAFAESERVRSLRSGSTQPTWTEVGPRPQTGSSWGNVSGRVTSLALDPKDKRGDTVFVGTAFGGVWRCVRMLSNNPDCEPSGNFDSQVTLSIGSIAASNEAGSTVIYVGTGEPNGSADSYYGEGILRSPDGGKSWEKAVFTDREGHDFSGAAISKITVNPENTRIVFAAVTTASLSDGRNVSVGIYRSEDAGKSWSLELDEGGVSDLVYDPSRKTYFAAVVGKGIYKRSSGNDKWEQVKSPFQCTGAITDTNFARASLATRDGVLWVLISDSHGQLSQPSADDFGLAESRDGGQNWSPVAVPNELFGGQGTYDQYLAAPPDSTALVIGGIDVWSTNSASGTNTQWTNLTYAYYTDWVHPDQHAIAFADGQRWYIGNDGGIWSTENAGGNWRNLNSSIGAIQFVSVTPDPAHAGGYFGGSQDNDVAYKLDGKNPKWATSLGGDGGYTAVDYQNHYFAENYGVSLFHSDSSSGQWKTVVDGRTINERQAFYIPYQILPASSTQVVLGTYRVWIGPGVPDCPGAGWKPGSGDLTRGSGYITAFANVPNSSKVFVVTSDYTVEMTEDILTQQPVWTDITDDGKGLPTGRAYSSVAVSPSDPDTVYVGVMGFGNGYGSGLGHVFKRVKDNEGFKWVNITGNLKDVPVNSILVDPQVTSNVYVATDAGVWLTTDDGAHWNPYGEGLPHSAVTQIKMSTSGQRLLVAATHGRGAWIIPLQ